MPPDRSETPAAARGSGWEVLGAPVRQRARRGMLVVEVVGALALAAVVLAIFAAATLQYGAAEREYDLRRVLLAAASAELDRIRVGARPLPGLDEAPPTPESNEIVVRVTARPGEGPWEGLVRVRVEASKRVRMDRVARVELSGYVEREERR